MRDRDTNESATYRLLVVDDDDAVRGAISTWFTRSGFQVDVASRGEDAVQSASENSYDAITMDIEMPGITGTEAIRRIRESNAQVPIIVLSGFQNDPDSIESAGANQILAKPISMRILESAVRLLLA